MLVNPFLHFLEKIYTFFVYAGSHLQSLFLLYMRLVWGHQFFMNGLAKGGGVGFLEMVCGGFLLIGFMSRMVTLPLIALTLMTLGTVHAEIFVDLRFLKEPLVLVSQQPYPFLIASLLVFIFGPGRVSVDAVIKHWLDHQLRY